MANETISQLPTGTPDVNTYIPAVNLTLPSGEQNIKVPASALMGAVGGGLYVQYNNTTGITAPIYGSASAQIYSPASATDDLMIMSLELKADTLAAPTYNLQIYGGDPSNGGVLVYDYFVQTGLYVGADGTSDFYLPTAVIPLYIPHAVTGSNDLWVTVINQDNNAMQIFPQILVQEISQSGVALPSYIAPDPYTGPLMDTVYVGPTRQFAEPRYALAALADGGTMYIDPGTYYLPFGVSYAGPSTPAIDFQEFGGNSSIANSTNRFVTGITIIGSGTYGANATVFNGRGGYGLNPAHPYRLVEGKGFLFVETNITIKNIQFYYCGGDDQVSDGEAGIYINSALKINGEFVTTIVNVESCAFDKNENGVFGAPWYVNPGESYPNGTGPTNLVQLNLTNCDYGYLLPNGGGGDGFSHDMYLDVPVVTVTGCNFYGDLSQLPWRTVQTVASEYGYVGEASASGNQLKHRGCYSLAVTDCWFRSQSGKWIDLPWGGNVTVTNTVFCNLPNAEKLVLGYNSEASAESTNTPISNMVFTGCTLYGSLQGAVLWDNTGPGSIWDTGASATTTTLAFDETTVQYWTNANASWTPNRNNSQGGADQTIAPNLVLAPPSNTTYVTNPAAPFPASMPAGSTVPPPLNP